MKDLHVAPVATKSDAAQARLYAIRAVLDELSAANWKLFLHPLVLTVWLLFSAFLAHTMDWRPPPRPLDLTADDELWFTVLSATKILRGPVVAAVPIILGIVRAHRGQWDTRTESRIADADIRDLAKDAAAAKGGAVSRDGRSGVWLASLDGGKTAVAMAALSPARPFSAGAATTKDAEQTNKETVYLSTLYVAPRFRRGTAGAPTVANGLVRHVLVNLHKHAPPSVQTVRALVVPELSAYVVRALLREGFVQRDWTVGEELGLYSWRQVVFELPRDKWPTSVAN